MLNHVVVEMTESLNNMLRRQMVFAFGGGGLLELLNVGRTDSVKLLKVLRLLWSLVTLLTTVPALNLFGRLRAIIRQSAYLQLCRVVLGLKVLHLRLLIRCYSEYLARGMLLQRYFTAESV